MSETELFGAYNTEALYANHRRWPERVLAMMELGDLRLDQLQPHQFGVIQDIEAADDDSERLMTLGVCSGRTVELIKAGDPLILRVFATRIGLSARLAARVIVRPLTETPSSPESERRHGSV